MKSMDQRIAELEAKLAQTQRELLRKPSREAMPLAARRGWFLGITRGTLSPGGSVDVTVWIWSGAKWRATNPIVIIEDCQDWFLNEDDTPAEAGTKVRVDWYETTWVVTAIYCTETDSPSYTKLPPSVLDSIGNMTQGSDSIFDTGDGGYALAFNSPGQSISHSGALPWQE